MGIRKRKLIFETCANCGAKIEDDEKAVLIDADNDLVFCSETCLQENFAPQIERLEREHVKLRGPADIKPEKFHEYEYLLAGLLNDPDQVWQETEPLDESQQPVTYFLGEFLHGKETVFYVAVAYLADERPSFVLLHFPTVDERLLEAYRRGEQIYDALTSEQGEDLSPTQVDEVDDFGARLHEDMLAHRSDEDIDLDEFGDFKQYLALTLDEPEEVWRTVDEDAEGYLIYLAHHTHQGETVGYAVVTLDEEASEPGKILFSFPTVDQRLLDRLRIGEIVFRKEGF